jgi:glutamate-1-semialdehyde 2,1-aminomutase
MRRFDDNNCLITYFYVTFCIASRHHFVVQWWAYSAGIVGAFATPMATSNHTRINLAQRPHSTRIFDEAQTLMPGGVNSPVRAFKSVGGGVPIVMASANGARLTDVDGNVYIDYVMTWGPAILGHAHPQVVRAVQAVAERGLSFGAPTELENTLASMVIERVPSIEMVRMVNSGTEAVMSAIRLARAYTQRPKLIKFEGCYHGHADSLLVKAGSGALSLGTPDSAGVPKATAEHTLTATFNHLESVEALLKQNPDSVAAILVEPVAGNMGCIPPELGFLEGLRQLCDEYGALLIFDEVMTGFRVAQGGAQQLYGVTPDITTLGKVLGGGLPVGAYGGKRVIMEQVAPLGPMYQAGTLSGNPLGMASGIETLRLLSEPDVYKQLDDYAKGLVADMQTLCAEHHVPCSVTQVGAMFSVFFVEGGVTCFADVCKTDREFFNRFYRAMLEAGIYMAPSPFEAAFTSTAHGATEASATLEAFAYALGKARL